MGIEPIDYEKLWREQLAREEDSQQALEVLDEDKEAASTASDLSNPSFTYTYIVTKKSSEKIPGKDSSK
jgi:hypothetical protein